jgi:hypothetical protein
VYHLEVVFVDVYGVDGACLVAFATVNAAVLLYGCRPLTDAYGFGRAGFEASHTTNAFFVVNFERVYEHIIIN